MDEEKRPILEKGDIQQGPSQNEKKIRWIHFILGPLALLAFIGEGIFTYVKDEWTQGQVKKEQFAGVHIENNISTCNIVNQSDPDYQIYKKVQQSSAQWLMYFNLANYIPALLMTLIWPALSDTYGRRRIILLAMLGVCIRFCGTAVVIYTEQDFYWILILNAFQGIFGGLHTVVAIMFSYVADLTHGEKQRVQGMVLMDFTLVTASLVSSPLSGLLIQTWGLDFANTGVLAAGFYLLSLVLACLFLPETLDKTRRQPKKPVLAVLKQTVSFFRSNEFQGKRLCYVALFLCLIFIELGNSNRSSSEIIYLLGQPFCWGPAFIGYFSLARHAGQSVLGLVALKAMQPCLSSEFIACLSCLSTAGGFILEAFAKTKVAIYCVPVASMLGFLLFPMVRGILSNMTGPDKQGAIFASIGIVEGIGSVLAIPENEVYAVMLSVMDGFIFLVMAFCSMLSFVCLLVYCVIKPRGECTEVKQLIVDENIKPE